MVCRSNFPYMEELWFIITSKTIITSNTIIEVLRLFFLYGTHQGHFKTNKILETLRKKAYLQRRVVHKAILVSSSSSRLDSRRSCALDDDVYVVCLVDLVDFMKQKQICHSTNMKIYS